VPVAILVDGKSSPAEAKTKAHIGRISLAVERRR
jgi:hypothetical protein